MILKKFFVYFFILNIVILPLKKANAVVPLVVGIGYAVDVAAPIAIRYLASDIAISAVAKAVQVSNAYYSATATASNAKFLKYFKGKAALGVAAFVGVLDALGLYLSNDSFYSKDESSQDPGAAQQGYFWSSPDGQRSSGSEVADIRISDLKESHPDNNYIYRIESSSDNSIRYYFYRVDTDTQGNVSEIYTSARTVSRHECSSSNGVGVSSCSSDFDPNFGLKVEDSDVQTSVLDYLSSLDESKQLEFFADPDGVLDSALVEDLTVDDAPPMLDGESPIPNIGDQSWSDAHMITTGVAQSSDSSAANYVPQDDWDNAYYLANTVANGNDYITGLNSGAVSIPDTTGTTPNTTTGEGSVKVDLSSIESRIDTTNSLNQSILEEFQKINSTTTQTKKSFDESNRYSFWTPIYPNGFEGVLNAFIEKMKQTDAYQFLSGFTLNLSSGVYPVTEFCFTELGFGCFELKLDANVWLAIKSMVILFSLVMARRIVFGG
ncbi:hypothetical protein [Vibrio mangrovi]|uniref:Uncharacterized protein n=1 Tax=Vibrio mangrovi TaxID=474394 RepID=A0A1Y6IXI8_9VIBR|nr:hypothetical protein [Vibrio mangrovi]MDW6004441.1 hypothetical protein [Vibrio mangrovi]MDW6004455.1 hypothetical protein [Vibrio mangrovi]SMS00743.1 hypothetical protein VIM7927_02012 [Vibrio mangrovi]